MMRDVIERRDGIGKRDWTNLIYLAIASPVLDYFLSAFPPEATTTRHPPLRPLSADIMATPNQRSTNRSQTNGVLPISATQTAGNASKVSANKSSGPRLKVVIRRLAPGLTETEFTKILGDEWGVGNGKVDWFTYKPGKNSKEYAHPLALCPCGTLPISNTTQCRKTISSFSSLYALDQRCTSHDFIRSCTAAKF